MPPSDSRIQNGAQYHSPPDSYQPTEMNGPVKIYPLRQIVLHDQPLQLPDCMYRLPNVHAPTNDNVGDDRKEMAEVVERQERVLRQLEELKRQMLEIRQSLHTNETASPPPKTTKSSPTNTTTNLSSARINVDDVGDVVITANPSRPPYSLVLLRKLWSKTLRLDVRVHIHSSVLELPAVAKEFSEGLAAIEVAEGLPVLPVTLIWKDVDDFGLFVSTHRIVGECNFLRFLARATSALDYDETTIDSDVLLDLSYGIARSKTKTERMRLTHVLKRRLGKAPYFFGDRPGVADLALYSALRQTASDGEVAGNLVGWMRNCESVIVQ